MAAVVASKLKRQRQSPAEAKGVGDPPYPADFQLNQRKAAEEAVQKRKLSQYYNQVNVLFIPFFVLGFWSLLATKLPKYKYITYLCLRFARLDGQDGKPPEKNTEKNHATKVIKISKTRRQKYGMNKT